MRKRKNGERRYWHWLKRGLLSLVVGAILILSMPTLYAFITYYHVPETELDSNSSLRIIEDELCKFHPIDRSLVLDDLKYKIMIDSVVVPYPEITVTEVYTIYDLLSPPTFYYVCTTQPNLAVGQHEFILFSYNVYSFQWVAQTKSIFTVDEAGNVTDDFN